MQSPAPSNDNTPSRKVRFKQADLTRAVRAFQITGLTIGRVEITTAGVITIYPAGAPVADNADDALARWQAANAH